MCAEDAANVCGAIDEPEQVEKTTPHQSALPSSPAATLNFVIIIHTQDASKTPIKLDSSRQPSHKSRELLRCRRPHAIQSFLALRAELRLEHHRSRLTTQQLLIIRKQTLQNRKIRRHRSPQALATHAVFDARPHVLQAHISHGVLATKIPPITTDSQRCTFGSFLGIAVLQPEARRPGRNADFGEDLALKVGFEVGATDALGQLAGPVDTAAVAPAGTRFVEERRGEARFDCGERSRVSGVEALTRRGAPADERGIEGVVAEPGGVRQEVLESDGSLSGDGDGAF